LAKKSRVTQPFNVSNLKYLMDEQKIWLNPEYQREAVWTRSQKQLLVDSLINGIDVPKLYFRAIDKDGYEYEVVDGQQRLRAISDFMNNEFTLFADADEVDGLPTAGRLYSEIDTKLQMKLQNTPLDVVVLNGYTDDDIEEIFLRLQNGTPLNAAEKRRAIPGTMRKVVEELAGHKVFQLSGFSPKRYAYEDAVAKVMHQLLHGSITDIKPTSIKRTYEANAGITMGHRDVRRLKQAFSFIATAFKGKQNPGFKKYSMISLPHLVAQMLDTYDLSKHPDEFADAILDFEAERVENAELPEEKQDPILAAYTNAARSDSPQDMKYRHDVLLERIVDHIPSLVLKDPNRSFSNEQRMAIYRKDGGRCQVCQDHCDEVDFHADHIKPHSKGGLTTVENGQVLCSKHNLSKGDGK